jgi:alpha-beta hydrolase superfamily lysophospholipase
MNASVAAGKLLARLVGRIKGADHRSNLLNSIAFSSYNTKFPKSEGKYAWLTREVERVNCRDEDPFTSYTFTASGYLQLFTALGECSSSKWFKGYPKSMNTLILGGTMDPVGQYGRGCEKVYKKLLLEGASAVSIKLYEGARHELFNESCREEVFADILTWFAETVK